ncbi:MAG: hypothetical protein E7130_01125 [Rikenellaceae bacterium]|nr:hypothetical protein [Rikenellaceae bacterium]
MRKNIILMLSLLATVGCSKSEFDNKPTRNRVEMSVSAIKEISSESSEVSRIEFNGSVYDMLWEADDQIGVYIAGTGEKANFAMDVLADDRKSARFRAEIYEPNAIDDYYAFYPVTTPFNGSIASFVLPNETTGATTPMLVAAHEGVAMGDVALNFKPVTALLELTLGFDADKVIVESNNGESLAGICAYNFGSNTVQNPTGSTSVTLTSATAGTHYLYMPEVTLSKGYKVIVEKSGQQMIKSVAYNTGKTFVAGEVTPLTISSFEGVTVNLCDVYTTYTLAQRKNSEANNTANTNIIFFNGNCSYSGISSTLVKECGVHIGGTNISATATNKQFSIANQTNKAQGSYEVFAYIKTIDGTTYKSTPTTVYITGLPYSISFGNTTSPGGWTVSNTKIGRTLTHSFNIFSFGAGDAYAISPSFYIPATTSVTATFMMYAYKSATWASYKPNVYISASTTDVASNNVATLSSQINTYGTATVSWSYPAATVNMTSSINKVCVHTSGSCSSTYYPCIPTESCTINYAF